jgi:hypothetical protein
MIALGSCRADRPRQRHPLVAEAARGGRRSVTQPEQPISSPEASRVPFDYPEGTFRESRGDLVRCHCFDRQWKLWQASRGRDPLDDHAAYRRRQRAGGAVRLHTEAQDPDCPAWQRLLELIEEAVAEGPELFAPLEKLAPDEAAQIVTLPATIAKLKSVKRLFLYGSSLVRVPPEIGEMSSLEVFDPYTSYRLHWFPYEITCCPKLRYSRVSTRALYGNFKYRWTFFSRG